MLRKVIHTASRASQQAFIGLIQLYRLLLKPFWGNRCRFYPSCSEYAQTALNELGTMRGLYLIIRRLLRCHPFHPGGYDPVPTNSKREMNNTWT